MLKKSYTKEEFAKLPKPVQEHYKEDGDAFTLDIDGGFEDVSALKQAKKNEVDAHKVTRTALAKANEDLTTLTEERDGLLKGSIPKADVEKLEKNMRTEYQKKIDGLTTSNGTLESQLQTLLVDNVASEIAGRISTAPVVLMPHIKSRIRAEKDDNGKYVTKIVNADGTSSTITTKDLEKEFVDNKAFASIIQGSKAAGSGASGGGQGRGAPSTSTVDFKKSPAEVAAAIKASGKLRSPGDLKASTD